MTLYKQLEVERVSIHGLIESMHAMRIPKKSDGDSKYSENGDMLLGYNDAQLAARLVRAGNDHAKAMRGIIVWLKMRMQVGFMIEFETYRHRLNKPISCIYEFIGF